MELTDKMVEVPTKLTPEDRGDVGLLPHVCALFGRAACEVGSPDRGANGTDAEGVEIDATDTVANVLHYAAANNADPEAVLRKAMAHFEEEEQQRG